MKWESFTKILKDIWGRPYTEKESDIHPEERKYGLENKQHLWKSQVKKTRTITQVNQKQVKVKRGNKSQKLKETARSTKISLFERISIEKI